MNIYKQHLTAYLNSVLFGCDLAKKCVEKNYRAKKTEFGWEIEDRRVSVRPKGNDELNLWGKKVLHFITELSLVANLSLSLSLVLSIQFCVILSARKNSQVSLKQRWARKWPKAWKITGKW